MSLPRPGSAPRFVPLALAGLVACALAASAQDPENNSAPPDQYRRLPPMFRQVGVTDRQAETIYVIRGQYRAQIQELTRRLEDLKAQELAECESVLTPAQKRLLDSRRVATGRKSGPAPSTPASSPPTAPMPGG